MWFRHCAHRSAAAVAAADTGIAVRGRLLASGIGAPPAEVESGLQVAEADAAMPGRAVNDLQVADLGGGHHMLVAVDVVQGHPGSGFDGSLEGVPLARFDGTADDLSPVESDLQTHLL